MLTQAIRSGQYSEDFAPIGPNAPGNFTPTGQTVQGMPNTSANTGSTQTGAPPPRTQGPTGTPPGVPGAYEQNAAGSPGASWYQEQGPTQEELDMIAQWASLVWGVPLEAAYAELAFGQGATEGAGGTSDFLRAALGMVRSGQMAELLAQYGGQPGAAAGAPPPTEPAAPPMDAFNPSPPGGNAPPMQNQFQLDTQFRDFYQQNPAMHAASQFGTPINAEAVGSNTMVTYADQNRRTFDPTGKELTASWSGNPNEQPMWSGNRPTSGRTA